MISASSKSIIKNEPDSDPLLKNFYSLTPVFQTCRLLVSQKSHKTKQQNKLAIKLG